MRPPFLFLLLPIVGCAIIMPRKQYDSMHHDPVYTRISTATSFGGEYEPSPPRHQPSFHPSLFPNPFAHSSFGECDCDEREDGRHQEEDGEVYENKRLPRRRHEEERQDRYDDDLPRDEKERKYIPISRDEEDDLDSDMIRRDDPHQYIAKMREIPSRLPARDEETKNEPAFTYLGPGYD